MIQIYDTFTRQKTELELQEPGRVGIYLCGPTVYSFIHIGNARTFISFDAVVRHLRARGLEVHYVRNVTDVDDKIINRANEEDDDPAELANRYIDAFKQDMDALGLLRPDVEPRVTTHMGDIIALIQRLIDRDIAYESKGDVYYATRRFAPYGQLSRKNIDDLKSGARVDPNEAKRDPLDFALWKAAKAGEPSWKSPWGNGRPGWHIECSAMAARHLGERFDIHGGGMDLIFPHHENEIAQSQGALGEGTFSRYWMHAGFLNLNEEKMSKSLGNIFRVREILGRHDGEAYRLYLLGAHYRHPLSFEVVPSDGDLPRFPGIEEAEHRLDYFYETLVRLGERADPSDEGGPILDKMLEAMDDDFNTPVAIATLGEAVAEANRLLDKGGKKPALAKLHGEILRGGQNLGLFSANPAQRQLTRRDQRAAELGVDASEIDQAIADRQAARKAKDFPKADQIRAALKAKRIELRDGPTGTTWTIK